MKVGSRAIFLVALIVALWSVSAMTDGILKYEVIDNTTPLELGTVVKLVGDMQIDACGSADTPVGVVIGYEGPSSAPEFYLVANSGMARNLLCASVINSGDKVIVFDDGAIRSLDSDPMGFVVGTAMESGSHLSRIKIMISLDGSGGGESHWTRHPDGYIFSSGNFFGRVHDVPSDGDTTVFYAENMFGYGGIFKTKYYGLDRFAGVYGIADASMGAPENYGVLGRNQHSGNWGYLGGQNFGAQGRFDSGARWSWGALGGSSAAVIGKKYSDDTPGAIGGDFFVQASTEGHPTLGVLSMSYSDSSYGVYAVSNTYSGAGWGCGLYSTAVGNGRRLAIWGEIESSLGINSPYMEWDWIEGASGTSQSGWVSRGGGDCIDNQKAAIYGENHGTDLAVGIVGKAINGNNCVGIAGFGGRFGILGVSTGTGSNRAGGAFHCNNFGAKGGAGEPTGIGVISSGGTAGLVTVSEHLGIYSATTIDSRGGAAYFSGNSYVSNGQSIALIDTATATKDAPRVPAFNNVGLSAKIKTEGIARLEGGRGFVELPSAFLRSVKNGEKPVIILTPYSADCKGLAVARFERDGFAVMELNDGESDAEFAWTASATRKDFPEGGGIDDEILDRNFDESFSRRLPMFPDEQDAGAMPRIGNEY